MSDIRDVARRIQANAYYVQGSIDRVTQLRAIEAELRGYSEDLKRADQIECAELVCKWCRNGKPRAEPVYKNLSLPVRWWHDDEHNDWNLCRREWAADESWRGEIVRHYEGRLEKQAEEIAKTRNAGNALAESMRPIVDGHEHCACPHIKPMKAALKSWDKRL